MSLMRSCTSRTVEGPRVQMMRRISSSASVGGGEVISQVLLRHLSYVNDDDADLRMVYLSCELQRLRDGIDDVRLRLAQRLDADHHAVAARLDHVAARLQEILQLRPGLLSRKAIGDGASAGAAEYDDLCAEAFREGESLFDVRADFRRVGVGPCQLDV